MESELRGMLEELNREVRELGNEVDELVRRVEELDSPLSGFEEPRVVAGGFIVLIGVEGKAVDPINLTPGELARRPPVLCNTPNPSPILRPLRNVVLSM